MECYATHWRLGGKVGIFSFCIEPSFAFSAPHSLSLLLIALSFILPFGGCVHACRPEGLQYM